MSHRVLLHRSSAANLLSCSKFRHVPISVLSSISSEPPHPRPSISPVQTRSAHVRPPRLASSNRGAMREDPTKGRIVQLNEDKLKLLARIGFSQPEADTLYKALHVKCKNRAEARYAQDCLQNRITWSQNISLVPKAYDRPWRRDKIDEAYLGVDIADLTGSWTDEAMGQACLVFGLCVFHSGQAFNEAVFVAEGCFFLQVAVLYGDYQAATYLVNILNDPISAEMVANSGLQTNTREALNLIKNSLSSDSPPPFVVLTHLTEACSPGKIGRQTTKQLEWSLAMLDTIDPPERDILENVPVYQRYQSPWQLKLQIIDHCLSRDISLPNLPHDQMVEMREDLLARLADENDPVASMIILARENGPETYSGAWERLLMAAAGGGNGHALWLLGVHHMRNEGVYPVTSETKARLETSLGFEYARLSIMALHDTPNRMVSYTLALAALCRAAGDMKRGFLILADSMNEALDKPNFPKDTFRLLDGNYRDWDITDPKNKAFWGEKKYGPLLEQYFDPHSKNMQTALHTYRS